MQEAAREAQRRQQMQRAVEETQRRLQMEQAIKETQKRLQMEQAIKESQRRFQMEQAIRESQRRFQMEQALRESQHRARASLAAQRVGDSAPESPDEKDMDFSGVGMRENVIALIDFVIPQIRRGFGRIPLQAVMNAMRVTELGLSSESMQEISERGDIVFAEGVGENRGKKVKADIAVAYGFTATVKIAPVVKGKVALNGDGGFTLSNLSGITYSLKVLPVPVKARQIVVSRDVVIIRGSFMFVPVRTSIRLTNN